MTKPVYVISFPETNYPPITLEPGQNLSQHLNITNSPVLFGCRTGICGTCLVRVKGNIPPPSKEEQEVLDILAPGVPEARLACQIELTSDLAITPFVEENCHYQ